MALCHSPAFPMPTAAEQLVGLFFLICVFFSIFANRFKKVFVYYNAKRYELT